MECECWQQLEATHAHLSSMSRVRVFVLEVRLDVRCLCVRVFTQLRVVCVCVRHYVVVTGDVTVVDIYLH